MLDPQKFSFLDFNQLYNFMVKFDKSITNPLVNAILRRMNSDTDFKINFKEFALNISPNLPEFIPKACLTDPTDIDLPKDPETNDIIMLSKFHHLLDHKGIAFNIEKKK